MSRSVALLAGSIWALLLTAQDPIIFSNQGGDTLRLPQHFLLLHGNYAFNADAIHNGMFKRLYAGGFIERDDRQQALDATGAYGRTGQQLQAGITWWGVDSLFKNPHWQCHIALSHHAMLGVKYTNDAFALTFFGNERFEGEVADLGGSAYDQQIFQQVGWGVIDRRSLSWLRVSLVKGQLLGSTTLDIAQLTTAPGGRSLDAEVLGSYYHSDTSVANDLGAFNGSGGALASRINWPVHLGFLNTHVSWVSLEVSELGAIAWNKNTLHQHKDSVVNYRGIYIEDIFDIADLDYSEDELLDTLGIRYEKGTRTRLMPVRIALGLNSRIGKNWSMRIGVDQRYLPGYQPNGNVALYRHFKTTGRLGIQLAYGGFGKARVGMEWEHIFGRSMYLKASAPNVIGFISDDALGLAAGLTLGLLLH